MEGCECFFFFLIFLSFVLKKKGVYLDPFFCFTEKEFFYFRIFFSFDKKKKKQQTQTQTGLSPRLHQKKKKKSDFSKKWKILFSGETPQKKKKPKFPPGNGQIYQMAIFY